MSNWWDEAIGYQVYVRSFADGDGDGIGDLHGVAEHLDYLAWLGIDVIWLAPCYPSPLADHGYDVADYTSIAEQYGGTAALETVLMRARELGLRVLLDLVPNHTSDQHPWFRSARSSRSDPYRDYYLWRDPAPDGGPPNNWVSHFGGPAWSYDEGTGQYYCHLFLREQPDLNWANPSVVAEFDDVIRFWLEAGVDGFRIDVAHALAKHPELPDLPLADTAGLNRPDDPLTAFDRYDHVHDTNRPEVLDIYRRWRRIAKEYDALLLGEVYLLDSADLAPYVVNQDGLHLIFWFAPMHLSGDDPCGVRRVLAEGADMAPGAVTWITSSHDVSRAATRLGGGDRGKRRALAIAALQCALPGAMFLYQGEELGLEDAWVPEHRAQDPIATRAGAHHRSRDPARTPMPWQPGGQMGFTQAAEAWLPIGDRVPTDTVAVQRDDQQSLLHRYRTLLAVRRQHRPTGVVEWLDGPRNVLAFRRGNLTVAANLGDERIAWEGSEHTELLWCSHGGTGEFKGILEPGQAIWVA